MCSKCKEALCCEGLQSCSWLSSRASSVGACYGRCCWHRLHSRLWQDGISNRPMRLCSFVQSLCSCQHWRRHFSVLSWCSWGHCIYCTEHTSLVLRAGHKHAATIVSLLSCACRLWISTATLHKKQQKLNIETGEAIRQNEMRYANRRHHCTETAKICLDEADTWDVCIPAWFAFSIAVSPMLSAAAEADISPAVSSVTGFSSTGTAGAASFSGSAAGTSVGAAAAVSSPAVPACRA